MTKMTETQVQEFLSRPLHSIVGTNSLDGFPQLSPVWYIYQEDKIFFCITSDTSKYLNLKRDARISLCMDGGRSDVRAVMFQGMAQIVEDDAALIQEWRWALIQHYSKSEEDAVRYEEETRDEDWILVIVTPDRIISQDFN